MSVIVVMMILFVAGCKSADDKADQFIDSLTYVKDSRTGICYGVVTQGDIIRGTVIVPEDKIPSKLLKLR